METETLPDGTILYSVNGDVGGRPYAFEDVDRERLLRIEELHIILSAQVATLPEPLPCG